MNTSFLKRWPHVVNSAREKTRHHKVPRSRCVSGELQPDNIVKIERQYHRAWHILFSNRTPFEIAILLIEKFFPHGYVRSALIHVSWQGRIEEYHYLYSMSKVPFEPWTLRPVQQKAWNLLFDHRGFYSVLHEVLTSSRWSPHGYFTDVNISIHGEGTIELSFENNNG